MNLGSRARHLIPETHPELKLVTFLQRLRFGRE
jgi:hypothetical protein